MVTTLDKYGRVIIPKKLRELLGITANTNLSIREEGNRIIIEPIVDKTNIIEKDGILVYTGNLDIDPDEWIKHLRNKRVETLSGNA